jgi:capsular polysaccharide biosynthesis protein
VRLATIRSWLPATVGDGDVVVLAREGRGDGLVEAVQRVYGRSTQVVVLPHPDLAEVAAEMSRLHRVALVVDLRPSQGPGQLLRWTELSPFLVQGGTWIAARSKGRGDDPRRERLVERLGVSTDEPVVWTQPDRWSVKAAPDAAADEILRSREPQLRVERLAERAGGELAPHTVVHHGDAPPTTGVPAPVRYPAAVLRRYRGAVDLFQGGLATSGETTLPDSFRWLEGAAPENVALRANRTWAAQVRRHRATGDLTHLEGPHYFLDYTSAGHFGHLMTEAVSKLWGWDAARATEPGVRLLLRDHPRRDRARRLERLLLPAVGITESDVTWVEGPARCDDLFGASPLWHNAPPFAAHPAITETWRRMREYWLGRATGAEGAGPRIFVTRRSGFRRCRNVAAVEEVFRRRGFAIVQPELLTLEAQVSAFARARVVAGFAGSGMFNLTYATERLRAVLVVSHTSYDARNEELYAAAHGVPLHYFWSPADTTHPEGGFDYRARQSHWAADLGPLDDLGDVLAAVDPSARPTA